MKRRVLAVAGSKKYKDGTLVVELSSPYQDFCKGFRVVAKPSKYGCSLTCFPNNFLPVETTFRSTSSDIAMTLVLQIISDQPCLITPNRQGTMFLRQGG